MQNIIITGSGRSGTSLLAGLFPEKYLRGGKQINPWEANPKGFFESKEVNKINEVLISQFTSNSLTYKNIKKGIFTNLSINSGFDYGQRWLLDKINRKNIEYKISQKNKKDILNIVSHTPFCLKDPRFSLTLPAWDKFLPEKTVIICVFRHPMQSATSIVKFVDSRKAKYMQKIDLEKAFELWAFQNHQNILNYKSSKRDWLFIHYDQIQQRNILENIESFTETKLDRNFFDPQLKHNKVIDYEISKETKRIYQELCHLANYRK